MGGIGLSCNLNRTPHAHTYTHTHMHTHNTQIQDTQMHNNTLANIYINTEYRTPQHNTHIPLCSTQKITQRTENRIQRTAHRCNREQRTTSTHRTTQSCAHSFDFYHHTYISKNSIT